MATSIQHSSARRWRAGHAAGARIHRNRPVTGLTQHADHSWTIHTAAGDIRAEIIVNAGGYRVNEVAGMMGVQHPVASMEHQYFLTEPVGAIADAAAAMPDQRFLLPSGKGRVAGRVLRAGLQDLGNGRH